MTDKKPLKRHKSLQPLSRDHHHGLLLSWKIRQGFKKGVDSSRIKTYSDWFYNAHLVPHFEMEEAHIFSLLAEDNPLRIQALEEHSEIKALVGISNNLDETLTQLADLLEQHIRFEERVLFPEIQTIATPEEMSHIETIHYEPNIDDKIDDQFWK